MVEIIRSSSFRVILAAFITAIISIAFPDLTELGEDAFQSVVVVAFILYCGIVTFTSSPANVFAILSIPVLTQFVQIFEKYSFPAGANSLWRLFPFLFLILFFIRFQKSGNIKNLSKAYKLFLLSWIIVQFFFLIITPELERILGGGIVLYLLVLPLAFIHFRCYHSDDDFTASAVHAQCLLFIILGLGTFGLIAAGSSYTGSENLIATRNISDTNVTMAYFILLWPFVLLDCRNGYMRNMLSFLCLIIFIGVVVFSFSRGAVLIIFPYILLSLIITGNWRWLFYLLLLATIPTYFFPEALESEFAGDLSYFWTLRFGDILSSGFSLPELSEVSGRADIHRIAFDLFLQNPVIGHGTSSFEILGPGYREAHSLFYTLLAEQGIIGLLYMYGVLAIVGFLLLKLSLRDKRYVIIALGFLCYLLFNHTVGSVFVILPGRSITVNCIAPMLLLCQYFLAKNIFEKKTGVQICIGY